MKKVLLALALLLAALGLVWNWRELYRPYRGYSENLVLEIEPGTWAPAVADLLVERGVLAHRLPFLFRYWLSRSRHSLKAGEYLFDRPLRPIDIYRKFVRGEVYLHPVVIPEGSDRFDMTQIFHAQLGLDPGEFLRATEQASLVSDLDPHARTLEGYLYPDKYRFARGTRCGMVVARMVARFRAVLNSTGLSGLREPEAGLHDLVTLASLVEKETPDAKERPIIAEVFARRLKKGMPLQCDPTVLYAARLKYGLTERAPGPITQDELNLDSPYNTYHHSGLPPGPICSPGQVSLLAALHPAPGDFLYFVSNNHRGHIFARTLAEHRRNVARYRRLMAALRPVASREGQQENSWLSKNPQGGARAGGSSAKSAKRKK